MEQTGWSVCCVADPAMPKPRVPSPRDGRSERTVSAILTAAERLFLAHSYADVTLDRIMRESGATRGGIYWHFASKEELYLEMMRRALGRMGRLFRAALARRGSCRERLAALTQAFFALAPEQSGLMRLVRRDANAVSPGARTELVRCYQEALPAPVEAILREGARSGELSSADPKLLARHFIADVEVALGRHADTVFPDPRAKLRHVLDQFFLGAAARAGQEACR